MYYVTSAFFSGCYKGNSTLFSFVEKADFMQGSLNKKYGDFVDRIYHIELEIKDTTDTDRSASYLDQHLKLTVKGG
jgi:hypothetical protein